jgi:hypothetical protein
MPASMTSADTGSKNTVTGSRMATPVVPPTPGSTPDQQPQDHAEHHEAEQRVESGSFTSSGASKNGRMSGFL